MYLPLRVPDNCLHTSNEQKHIQICWQNKILTLYLGVKSFSQAYDSVISDKQNQQEFNKTSFKKICPQTKEKCS